MTTSRFWLSVIVGICCVFALLSCGGDRVDGGNVVDPPSSDRLSGGLSFQQVSTQSDIHGIFGFAADDVYLVGTTFPGSEATILHYNGTDLRPVQAVGVPGLREVWGSSPTDVFAVGMNGTILHYDGEQLVHMESGVTEQLMGVSGSSESNVYAVGRGGTVLHYNGLKWDTAYSEPALKLQRVWVSPTGKVYAVSAEGTTVTFDGTSWSHFSIDRADRFLNVWGTGDDDIYAIGRGNYQDTILHFDGSSWQPLLPAPDVIGGDVGVTESGDIYCTKDVFSVGFFDGSAWTTIRGKSGAYYGGLFALWVADDSTVFIGGSYGIIEMWNGTEWHRLNPDCALQWSGDLSCVIECPNGDVVIAGGGMPVSQWDGRGWRAYSRSVAYALWSETCDTIYASGYNGRVYHYVDGGSITMHFPEKYSLVSMWGDSEANMILTVGDRGYAVKYDGISWQEMPSTGALLWDLHGIAADNIYAVGEQGKVLHYDGSNWTEAVKATEETLHAIWGATEDNMYAVGENGAMIHYDGSRWQTVPSGVGIDFYGLWGDAADNIFAVGAGGMIRRWDGFAWSTLASETECDLHDIVGTSDGDYWVVGDNSTILRLRRE